MQTEQQGAAAPSEREQFEMYAKEQGYRLKRSVGGSYLYGQAAIAWRAWQAARAQPPAVVEPLTNEQIDDIWVEHGCEGENANAFARAIEQAHGIGIRKEDSNDQ